LVFILTILSEQTLLIFIIISIIRIEFSSICI